MPLPTDHVYKTNGSRSVRPTIVVGSTDCSNTIDACLDVYVGEMSPHKNVPQLDLPGESLRRVTLGTIHSAA